MRAEHLYVHVPFCARRCVYCDFSIAVRPTVPVGEYLSALAAELNNRHRESELQLATLYFGGGTPSKLGGEGVARAVDAVRSRAELQPDAEVTLEANPEDVSPENARQWKDSGINRVSLGVQSFDDSVLRWMHRPHDSAQARSAVHVLRDIGIANISIDLIFATPSAITRSWSEDLDQALQLGVPHVSIYGLTVESHTPLGRWVSRSDVAEAPEERFEAEFLDAHAAFTSAGYDHYEVSNYGRPGAHSRHNWAYWNRKPYVGVGPSAHEFTGEERRWNVSPYAEWTRKADSVGTLAGCESLSREQVRAEQLYLALRTSNGVVLSGAEISFVEPWIHAGWALLVNDNTLRLTAPGWLRLDAIASSLTSLRSRY